MGPDLVLPAGNQENIIRLANEVVEQASPDQLEESNPSQDSNILADEDTHTGYGASEETQYTLNIRLSNNGSVTQSSLTGNQCTRGGRISRRLTAYQHINIVINLP